MVLLKLDSWLPVYLTKIYKLESGLWQKIPYPSWMNVEKYTPLAQICHGQSTDTFNFKYNDVKNEIYAYSRSGRQTYVYVSFVYIPVIDIN